jgi:GTPase
LAITKADLLDEELIDALKTELPDVKYLFISAVSGYGIPELKDMIWEELNDESNRVMTMTHHLPDNVVLATPEGENEEYNEDEDGLIAFDPESEK